MREFFKKLTGNSKKSFREIPTDREATYKQRWAVAWQFARECAEEFPDVTSKGLAVVFNAVILKYHSDPKNNSKLTHGDVQAYLGGDKKCPEYYKRLIDIKPKDNLKKVDSTEEMNGNEFSKNQIQEIIDLYKQGQTHKEIGKAIGLTASRIGHLITRLRKQGYDIPSSPRSKRRVDYKYSEEEISEIISLYNQRVTYREMGEVLNLSAGQVQHLMKKLKQNGYDIGNRGQNNNTDPKFFSLSDTRKVGRFLKMYNDGYTLKTIGNAFGMTGGSVRNYLIRLKERGVDIEFRGMGTRTDNKYPHNKRPKIVKEENASNKKLLNIMNSQKRR